MNEGKKIKRITLYSESMDLRISISEDIDPGVIEIAANTIHKALILRDIYDYLPRDYARFSVEDDSSFASLWFKLGKFEPVIPPKEEPEPKIPPKKEPESEFKKAGGISYKETIENPPEE